MAIGKYEPSDLAQFHLREAIRELAASEQHLLAGGYVDLATKIRAVRKKLEGHL
jgi:hypothetical protein